MKDEKPSYEELESRLRTAEALVDVLKSNEIDAIISQDDVSFVRGRSFEEQARKLKAELERLVAERTTRLRHLTIELTQAEQRERQRLAELLHDHLQQLLAGARLRLGMLDYDQNPTAYKENMEKIEELMNQAMQASRSLCQELSPPDLFTSGLQAALSRLAEQMQDMHALTVDIDFEAGAEPECENIRILLFQAARELLFNVVKHGNTQAARLELKQQEPARLCVRVSDDGRGFDPEKGLEGGNGTGLGLFSIRERLEALGGKIDIASAPGRGCRISLYVPSNSEEPVFGDVDPAPPKGSETVSLQTEQPQTPAEKRNGSYRILIADDHKMFREGLVSMLSVTPAMEIVGEAHDGQMAVELARNLRPDVIIMDISMPRLNGIEATRIITSEMPATRVIALSMHQDEMHGSLMRKAGAEAFLTKDGPMKELVAAIYG